MRIHLDYSVDLGTVLSRLRPDVSVELGTVPSGLLPDPLWRRRCRPMKSWWLIRPW